MEGVVVMGLTILVMFTIAYIVDKLIPPKKNRLRAR